MPMELYWQLKKNAAAHNETPAARARHILCDALMDTHLTRKDYDHIKQAIEENWRKIRRKKNGTHENSTKNTNAN